MGPSYARNMGIKYSKYNYIAFVDSYDIWHKEKLEKQVNKINSAPETKSPADKYKLNELEGNIFNSLWNANKIGTPTILVKKSVLIQWVGFGKN